MNIERYNELKNYVAEKLKISEIVIEEYNNFSCRFNTARFLINLERYKDALELLLTIDQKDTEEMEQWIWVLKDTGVCYWKGHNKEEALEYFRKADVLAVSTNEEFSFLVRGEVWGNILYVLKELNRNDELQAEIKTKIDLFKNKNKQYKSNSYLFYAYKFIAANESDINKALEYLYKAIECFPLGEEKYQESFKEIWDKRESNPYEAFEDIIDLTHHEVCWDI